MSYAYDANGDKVAMSDASGTSSFAHEPFGELTSATGRPDGRLRPQRRRRADRDHLSAASTATWAADTAAYNYDDADELTFPVTKSWPAVLTN